MELNFDETKGTSKKQSTKWRENKTLDFIRAYRSHPCLWDTSLETYKDKEARMVAYQDMKTRFGLSLPQVKNKIKSLRSTYNLELKKYKYSENFKSSGGKKFESSLIWFKEMDAMLMKTADYHYQSGNNLTSEGIEIPPDSSFGDILPRFNEMGSDDNLHLLKPSKEECSDGEEVYNPAASKRESVPNRFEDEFELFGRHAASQLREMNIVRALRVMSKIQFLLCKERMEELQVTDVLEEFSM